MALRTSTLLAGAALLTLSASIATAAAAPIFADTTPGLTSVTVPAAGSYDILATGAGGGNGRAGAVGGLGATVEGTFSLTAGEALSIAVGGRGASGTEGPGGGGGASFVVAPGNAPLVIAAGGGGNSTGFNGGAPSTAGYLGGGEAAGVGEVVALRDGRHLAIRVPGEQPPCAGAAQGRVAQRVGVHAVPPGQAQGHAGLLVHLRRADRGSGPRGGLR